MCQIPLDRADRLSYITFIATEKTHVQPDQDHRCPRRDQGADRRFKTKEDELKAALGDLDVGAYEGELFRLSISETDRETLDMKAVRAHLSRQFIAAHTNVTPVRTLKVSARTGKDLAA